MKRFLFITIFYLSTTAVFGQDVKLIKFEDLEKRMANSPDTVYIVNFWATWCAPCVKELPYFDQLAEKYNNEPIKVILCSLDFKSKLNKEVIPFLKKNQVKSEVVLNENNDEKFINSVDSNWSGAIPSTLVIHGKKEIRAFYEKEFTFTELEKIYLQSK